MHLEGSHRHHDDLFSAAVTGIRQQGKSDFWVKVRPQRLVLRKGSTLRVLLSPRPYCFQTLCRNVACGTNACIPITGAHHARGRGQTHLQHGWGGGHQTLTLTVIYYASVSQRHSKLLLTPSAWMRRSSYPNLTLAPTLTLTQLQHRQGSDDLHG